MTMAYVDTVFHAAKSDFNYLGPYIPKTSTLQTINLKPKAEGPPTPKSGGQKKMGPHVSPPFYGNS